MAEVYDRSATLPALFTAAATRFSGRAALIADEGSLTYAKLLAEAQEVAACLQQQGIGAGDTVGILARRRASTIVNLLGVLLAGAAYLALDPCALPGPLLAEQAKAAGVRGLVWGEATVPEELSRLPVLHPAATAGTYSAPRLDAGSAAYVMFTSGSTGAPKGVAVPHRAIARLVCGQQYASFGAGERVLLHSPLSFDASTFEIWSALLHGGTLVLAPDRALAIEDYERLIAQHRLTTLWLTAAVFHLVARHTPGAFAGLAQLLVGGDVVSPAAIERVQHACPGVRLINGYGPTESTTFALTYTVPEGYVAEGALPIGRPIAHTTAYVLDEAMEPVPDGREGQLALGGDGVALGYVNEPRMTAERFKADSFSADPDARLYLTGDRVVRDESGLFHFRGRLDQEAKIAGHRVQLQEVEALVAAHPGVQHAVVCVRGASAEDRQVVAVVEPAPGAEASLAGELRGWLRERLPRYAAPAGIHVVKALPLNAHGKLDRAAALKLLEQPSPPKLEPAGQVAASSQSDAGALAAVLAVWSTILESDEIAPDTNFFDAGGDSLLLIQLHFRLNKLGRGAVDLIELFSATTPRKMAALLEEPVGVR